MELRAARRGPGGMTSGIELGSSDFGSESEFLEGLRQVSCHLPLVRNCLHLSGAPRGTRGLKPLVTKVLSSLSQTDSRLYLGISSI